MDLVAAQVVIIAKPTRFRRSLPMGRMLNTECQDRRTTWQGIAQSSSTMTSSTETPVRVE